MHAVVLGSGAGGGVPQWNCACPNCGAARSGEIPSRTQDSIAVSADGAHWILVNASPDVRVQMQNTSALHPRADRSSPARDVILTNADIDHTLGLFVMRESTPLAIWCTAAVRHALERNELMRALDRFEGQLTWRALRVGSTVEIAGLPIEIVAAPGKPPMWIANPARSDEDNIALVIGDSLAYATSASRKDAWLDRISRAKTILFDGTFYTSDELIRMGLGTARAEDMAHWPVSESAPVLESLGRRIIYTHINNTNPILASSPEREDVERRGIGIAHDGMII